MKRLLTRRPSKGQRGYALLMVVFLAATMMILAVVGSLSIRTQGQREKEDELAWRGEQYVRAIRLFYKKNGRFPKTMDELTAYHTDQPRYIRQAYKDPMNNSDGSWRVIYVLPNGQLSGTTIHKQLQGSMPISGPLGGTPAGGTGAPSGTGPTASNGQQPTTGAGTGPPATPGQTPTQSSSDSQSSDSPVFGGSMIGVASKIKTPSLRIYKDGKTYYEWEFFWDPTSTSGAPGTPQGVTPINSSPANPGQTSNPGRGGSGQ